MAYPYTRSDIVDSDVEPSDPAPSAVTSSQPSILAGPYVETAEGPESVSAGLAGPVSAPLTLPQWEALQAQAVTVYLGLRVLLMWGS